MAKLITNLAKSSKKSKVQKDDDIDLDAITSDVKTEEVDDGHESQATYNIGEIDIAEVANEDEGDINLKDEIKKIVGKKDAIDDDDDGGIWVSETELDDTLDFEDDFLNGEKFDSENTDEDYDE